MLSTVFKRWVGGGDLRRACISDREACRRWCRRSRCAPRPSERRPWCSCGNRAVTNQTAALVYNRIQYEVMCLMISDNLPVHAQANLTFVFVWLATTHRIVTSAYISSKRAGYNCAPRWFVNIKTCLRDVGEQIASSASVLNSREATRSVDSQTSQGCLLLSYTFKVLWGAAVPLYK